jgi:hypothetical protein
MKQSTREINRYGDGLSVLICCQPTLPDAWLSFACWYSIRNSLPDAQVALACSEREKFNYSFFRWAFRAKVPHLIHAGPNVEGVSAKIAIGRGIVNKPLLMVPSHVMVMDCLDDDTLLRLGSDEAILDVTDETLPAKGETLGRFCSVRDGVGSFVLDKWIDKNGYPFGSVDHFMKGPLTANERRIFQMWKRLGPLYDTIG